MLAIIYVLHKLGEYDVIFHGASSALTKSGNGGIILSSPQYLGYSTLALGSALALFPDPHAVEYWRRAIGTSCRRTWLFSPCTPSCSASLRCSDSWHSPRT